MKCGNSPVYNFFKKIFFLFFISVMKEGILLTTFFFLESFNLWRPLLMIDLYHQTKTLISFWYRQRLNPKSLIQPTKILLVKLTGTHKYLELGIHHIYIES